MKVRVYRDIDTLRLRKLVIEILDDNGDLLDRTRMFGGLVATKMLGLRVQARIRQRLRVVAALKKAVADV